MNRISALSFAIYCLMSVSASAGVKVTERTKNYVVSGTTAAEIARSMSKRGPYSRAHRSRAWATAERVLRFQIDREISNGTCRILGADVRMKIVYTLPKLRNGAKIGVKQRRKWQKMSALLLKHEKVHGRFYRQLAHRTHNQLRKLKKEKTCRALDKSAKLLVEHLSKEDSARNRRFDERDSRNYRRMNRLFAGS